MILDNQQFKFYFDSKDHEIKIPEGAALIMIESHNTDEGYERKEVTLRLRDGTLTAEYDVSGRDCDGGYGREWERKATDLDCNGFPSWDD